MENTPAEEFCIWLSFGGSPPVEIQDLRDVFKQEIDDVVKRSFLVLACCFVLYVIGSEVGVAVILAR